MAFQCVATMLFSLECHDGAANRPARATLRATADPRIGKLYKEISEAIDRPYGEISPGAGEPPHKPLPESCQRMNKSGPGKKVCERGRPRRPRCRGEQSDAPH